MYGCATRVDIQTPASCTRGVIYSSVMVQEDPTPGPFVSRAQRPSPALRQDHINSRGIQLNGSKVLSKYGAAPKSPDRGTELEGDTIWVVSGIKMQIRINTRARRTADSVLPLI